MNAIHWRTITALVVSLTGLCLYAFAMEAPPHRGGDLGFLDEGKAYAIHFAAGSNIFKSTTSGVTSTSYVTEDGEKLEGRPATWSMTLTNETFRIVRLSESSWVLLEHPASPDDAFAWARKCRARAVLESAQRQAIKGKADGDKRLETLEQQANEKVSTSQTWVNLAHAVTISDLPTEDETDLPVKSTQAKP